MKTSSGALSGLLAVALAISAAAPSCNKLPEEQRQGSLSWTFPEQLATRSIEDLPDTDSFILAVTNSSGDILYEGRYGDSPQSLDLAPGSYTVRVLSRPFSSPEFSAPQYGDEQVAVVQSGTRTNVVLKCTQLNSGIRLKVSSDFRSRYPGGYLTAASSKGKLKYLPSESRVGFFSPGKVTISLFDGNSSTDLTDRYVEACEMLTLGVACPSEAGTDPFPISLSVDTTRIWYEDTYVIGSGSGSEPGTSLSSAFSVTQAKENLTAKGVWVCGYIVGGDLTSSKTGMAVTGPFTSSTNIAIAPRSSVTDKSLCLSVKLGSGDARDALNLVDNQSLLGHKVYLKGDMVSAYYGIPGIQNITEYSLVK